MECCKISNLLKFNCSSCCNFESQLDQDYASSLHSKDKQTSRDTSRWNHVTSLVQRWRINRFSSISYDDGTISHAKTISEELLDDAVTSYDVPILLSAFRYDRNHWAVPFPKQNPSLRRDVFFLVLQHRQGFILPKFYPKSLHIINDDSTLLFSPSFKRRYSDPELTSLRSKWTNNYDRSTIFRNFDNYQRSRTNKIQKTHQLTELNSESTKPCSTTLIEIKQKLYHKVSDFWSASKTLVTPGTSRSANYSSKGDETETFANLIDSKPPKVVTISKDSFLFQSESYSIQSSKQDRTESKIDLIQPADEENSRLFQPTVEKTLIESSTSLSELRLYNGSESVKDVMQVSAQECSDTPREWRNSSVIIDKEGSESGLLPVHDTTVILKSKKKPSRVRTFSISSNQSSSSTTSLSKDAVVSKFKQFQGTVGNITSKFRKKYGQSKCSSPESVEEDLVKPLVSLKRPIVFSSSVHCDEKGNHKSVLSIETENRKETLHPSASLPLKFPVESMNAHSSHSDKSTGEPLAKHRRSISMSEESDISVPSKPERGNFVYKHKLPSKNDNFQALIYKQKYEETGELREDLHASRRKFIHNMVHTDSSEWVSKDDDFKNTERPSLDSHKSEDPIAPSDIKDDVYETLPDIPYSISLDSDEFDPEVSKLPKELIKFDHMWASNVETISDFDSNEGLQEEQSVSLMNVNRVHSDTDDNTEGDALANKIYFGVTDDGNGHEIEVSREVNNELHQGDSTLNYYEESDDVDESNNESDISLRIGESCSSGTLATEVEKVPNEYDYVVNKEKNAKEYNLSSQKSISNVSNDSQISDKSTDSNECEEFAYGGFEMHAISMTEELSEQDSAAAIACVDHAKDFYIEGKLQNSNEDCQGAVLKEFSGFTSESKQRKLTKFKRSFSIRDNDDLGQSILNEGSTISKSDSQPQIYVTPADDSEGGKQSSGASYNEFALSTAGGVKTGSLESQSTSALLSEIEIDSISPATIINNPFQSDKHRPTTPKSPITVQEWVDSLPDKRVDDTGETEWKEDDVNFVLEERPNSFHKRRSTKELIVEEHLLLGDDASALTSSDSAPSKEDLNQHQEIVEKQRAPPLTLKDIQRALSRDESEGEPSWKGGTKGKRLLFAETRDKQTSFQSETSNFSCLSHQTTVSSIDSLLESRQMDPVDILLNLGFGGNCEDEGISRIPARFLRPSKVPGNDINVFLKQEDNISDLVDTSEWVVPGMSTQVLRKSSVSVMSPLVSNLLNSVKESKNRMLKKKLSMEGSIESYGPKSKFANVARGLGKQATVMSRLSRAVERKSSVFGSGFSSSDDGRGSVLSSENRLFLQLQGQQSPVVSQRRLILGSDSYNINPNGDIIDNGQEGLDIITPIKPMSRHRDSVTSIISSTTSIDSREEEEAEQLHKLRLSLMRPRPSSGNYYGDKKKNLIMRLSNGSKRKSYTSQSSGSSWEVDQKIPEESPETLQSQIILENLIVDDQYSPDVFESDHEDKVKSEERNLYFPKTATSTSDSSSSEDENSLSASFAKNKKKSVIRQPNLEDTHQTTHGNWSLENKSLETVKHFPLKRSLALVPSSEVYSLTSNAKPVDVRHSSLEKSALHKSILKQNLMKSDIRRTYSLPDVSVENGDKNQDPKTFNESMFDVSDREYVKNTLQHLQKNVNEAMLAMLQTCKTQLSLQELLSPRRPNSAVSFCSKSSDCFNKSVKLLSKDSSLSRSESSSSKLAKGSRETIEVASNMKQAINSVIVQLEHYLNNVSPNLSESQTDIAHAVGQMLYLSHQQSELCSEMERLSSPEMSSPSTYSPRLSPRSSLFYRSTPSHLSTSLPLSSPIPPLHSYGFNSASHNARLTSSSRSSPAITQHKHRDVPHLRNNDPSLSESSLEGSFDGADNSIPSDWNEYKRNCICSPAYQWPSSVSSDGNLDDIVKDKISQEIRDNLAPTVDQINSNMTHMNLKVSQLTESFDKNIEEVSDLKNQVKLLLQKLSTD